MRFPTPAETIALCALLTACAPPASSRSPNVSGNSPNAPPPPASGVEAEPPVANAALPATAPSATPASSAAPGFAAPNTAPAPLGPSPTNERHGPPLPELSVKSFGLHVGGSKDAGAR
ncbi:MAG TPA: hypothetical protein VLJ38_10385, partial [Polyangiaceae bacterium]|nr:hypothetical protein [Polyangiaceae bacterium]